MMVGVPEKEKTGPEEAISGPKQKNPNAKEGEHIRADKKAYRKREVRPETSSRADDEAAGTRQVSF